MIKAIKEAKEIDQECLKNLSKYNSKYTYLQYRKKSETVSKCEIDQPGLDWKYIYKALNNKKMTAEMRSFNFKTIHNGLSYHLKFPYKKNVKCVFCKKEIETREHIFMECGITRYMYEFVATRFALKSITRESEPIMFNINVDENDIRVISAYKMGIWRLRFLITQGNIKDFLSVFKKIFLNIIKNN
jgi:hypothetical protein